MSKKSSKNKKQTLPKKRTASGKNLLLTLTLVPLVIGMILLGAWALDMELLPNPQAQITVSIFFFLLAFTTSNALQKRWRLTIGWGLLALASIITLAWLNVIVQGIVILCGLLGLVFLGIEFYHQYQAGKQKTS